MNANCKSVKFNFLFCVCILLSAFSYGQLANFSLQVTATDETCAGNGSLQFSTTGTTLGASVYYSLYLLPETTTPVAVINSATLTGLTAGNYRVVALQTLGSLSNSQQQDIAILDNTTPMSIQIQGQALNCLIGNITVNISRGNPILYEIISGPVLVGPQTSNFFANLPLGLYTLKVTDDCGNAVVQSHTLVFIYDPINLLAYINTRQECALVDCNTKAVKYQINTPMLPLGLIIPYPFEAELTVFPPNGGAPVILTQMVSSGDTTSQEITFNIPYYNVYVYLTSIKITDPCGNILATTSNMRIFALKELSVGKQSGKECLKEINVNGCNLLLPFSIEFVSSPVGFNPIVFNPLNLGPFYTTSFTYASDSQNEIPDGLYVVKLTDACGYVLQDQVTVENSVTDIDVPDHGFFEGCIYKFPITIGFNGLEPTSVIITQAPANFNHSLPYDMSSYINEETGVYSFNFSIPGDYTAVGINVCGFPFKLEFEVLSPDITPDVRGTSIYGCLNTGIIYFNLYNGPPISMVLISQAPTAFQEPLPFDASSYIAIDIHNPLMNDNFGTIQSLPLGDYTIVITDLCGAVYGPYTVTAPLRLNLEPLTVKILEGCEIGWGSLEIALPLLTNTYLETVIITAAPSTYIQSLPYDVSTFISGIYGNFYMNSLPQGTYTFYTKDSCGVEHTFEVTIGNHFFDTTAVVEGNCSSFNLYIQNSNTPVEGTVYFVLQKFNPVTNQWMHPLTGFPFQPWIYPNGQNSYFLSNANYNITSQGTFRILKLSYIYSNGTPALIPCIQLLKEFEFTGTLKITNAYKIACLTGTSQVLVVAGDTNPLTYQIIEKDGLPFLLDNGNSNVFNGLVPGIYKFQVSDLCGNAVTRLFDLNTLSEPVITSSNLCDGQAGQLLIQPFSFLSYQWWNANDPTTILSTSNTLNFTPFNITTTPGTYIVRVYSESVFSCVDKTIAFVIPNAMIPNAGNNAAITICNAGSIDLNTILSGVHDIGGIWTETTASGMLSGHYWLPANLPVGTYSFNYVVNGFCGVFDEATVVITLLGILPNPVITADSNLCLDSSIQLNVSSIPNATFQWTGPNGFYSIEQNPTIENSTALDTGVYTVVANTGTCASSPSSVMVNVENPPQFQMTHTCIENENIIIVDPIANSFDPTTASYLWSGPENFTSSENPITITGAKSGVYGVTVTTLNGCSTSATVAVTTTLCNFPAGISPNGDGDNDILDLTGFEVLKFKVFSRYGRVVFEQDNY
ncbi:MAG: gliding motility-associated C-terminal domain-containing protein, partial [Burkholderiales bacterium]|nr:gliding motility-associated C-terminal domain-containing protein [Flavobacterium sp.]